MSVVGKVFGGVLGIGLQVGFSGMTYKEKKEQGLGTAAAFGIAAGEFAAWQVATPIMMGLALRDVLPSMYQAGHNVWKSNVSYANRQYSANFGGNYVDTQGAATMRQAGLSTISQSRQRSVQGSLGSEARTYYRR